MKVNEAWVVCRFRLSTPLGFWNVLCGTISLPHELSYMVGYSLRLCEDTQFLNKRMFNNNNSNSSRRRQGRVDELQLYRPTRFPSRSHHPGPGPINPPYLLPCQLGSTLVSPTFNPRMALTRLCSSVSSHDRTTVAGVPSSCSNIYHPDVTPGVLIPDPIPCILCSCLFMLTQHWPIDQSWPHHCAIKGCLQLNGNPFITKNLTRQSPLYQSCLNFVVDTNFLCSHCSGSQTLGTQFFPG